MADSGLEGTARSRLESLPQFQKESPSLLNKAAQLAYNPTLAVASIPHAVGQVAAGLMNLPFYAGQKMGLISDKPQPQFVGPDIPPPQAPFAADKPFVQIPFKPTNMQPEAPDAVSQANKVLGMATPETAAVIAGTMGAGAPEAAAGYFAPKMIADLPADLKQRYQTISNPGSTWREKAQEVLGAGWIIAMATALLKASSGIESDTGIPEKQKIQVRSIRDDLNKMVQRESDVRAVNAGSPFLRANAPGEGPINMGLQPPIVGRDPSGLRLVQEPQVQPAQPFPEISPPAPSMGPEYQSGRAAQNVREMGNQRAREQDFSQAIAEQVSQQHEQPIHPTSH